MKAAIYARFSSDLQRDASIDNQVDACSQRAEGEGWTVAEVYADRAISGTTANRPEYQRLLKAAKAGEFDVLIMNELSRLARDPLEQERAIRVIEFRRIRIVSLMDGYDSTHRSRKMLRAIKGMQNESELDTLKERTHLGLSGQFKKGFWTGGRPYGYCLRPVLDQSKRDPYDQPARIGSRIEVNPEQAPIVVELFTRFAAGEPMRTIAADLNARGVPSPGSSWKRVTRRCSGWMSSAIHQILRNRLYCGHVTWNRNHYEKDPETEGKVRRRKAEADWLTYHNEQLRIVSDELFRAAQHRTQPDDGRRVRSGSRAKYLLSGLLRCSQCGSTYTLSGASTYACSGHLGGGACDNTVRVSRETAEHKLLGPDFEELLSPERVERMAKELQTAYLAHQRSRAAASETTPREVRELDARLERLRERLHQGDPDMTTDELQATIDRVTEKRRALVAAQPEAKNGARVLAVLPRAAQEYKRQIKLGLSGDERASLKARVIVRNLFGGRIDLTPEPDGGLIATSTLHAQVLVPARTGTVDGPCANRTRDQQIKSLLLYRLS